MSASSGSFATLADLTAAGEQAAGGVTAGDASTDFSQETLRAGVKFDFDHVIPPAAIYVARDDVLNFHVISNVANNGVVFAFRLLRLDGVVIAGQQTFSVPGDGADHVGSLTLAEGFLLSLTIAPIVFPTRRGQLYCDMGMVRAGSPSGQRTIGIISGYVTSVYNLAWPWSKQEDPSGGNGVLRGIPVANPGLGNQFLVTVPSNRRWRFQAMQGNLNCSVVVANRLVTLFIDDGVEAFVLLPALVPVTAGQVGQFNWMPGSGFAQGVSTSQSISLPRGLQLAAGWRISSGVTGMDPGDQWLNLALSVEEWIEFT